MCFAMWRVVVDQVRGHSVLSSITNMRCNFETIIIFVWHVLWLVLLPMPALFADLDAQPTISKSIGVIKSTGIYRGVAPLLPSISSDTTQAPWLRTPLMFALQQAFAAVACFTTSASRYSRNVPAVLHSLFVHWH